MRTLDEQKAYWLTRLSGRPGAVSLPTDRERPPVSSFLRETISLALDSEICAQVRNQASNGAASPFVALLAALNAILYRYTGSTDISVGALLKSVGGPVPANLVILRNELSGGQSAEELMRQVSVTVEEAAANCECPLSAVIEALGPEAVVSDAPLFAVAFTFSSSEAAGHAGCVPERRSSEFADELVRCDLVLNAKEGDGGIRIECEYDAELFNASTIERFLQHFGILLAGMTAEPQSRLASLPLLAQAELKQLLVEWNDTRKDFPKDACIHQLFEAQVERTPADVAVVFGEQKLNYRQLNARANQLAHRLRRLGVGPDALVGICVERSLEMVIGLLGILKAGGAYVPLDPNYPRERLAFMLKDAGARVLLTQQRLLNELAENATRVICLE